VLHDLAHDEPFSWWGPVWSPAVPRGLGDLLHDRVLTLETAALLWTLMSRRASLAVIAGPRGAGKSTLLRALLDFYPPDHRRIYVRGRYDPLTMLDHPAVDPRRTLLLVNEISHHFPFYLWGDGVARLLDTRDNDFTFATTAHAADAADLARSLSAAPLRLGADTIRAIDLVVTLDVWSERGAIRRTVRQVSGWCPPSSADLVPVSLSITDPTTGQSRYDVPSIASLMDRLGDRLSDATIDSELRQRTTAIAEMSRGSRALAAEALTGSGQKWVDRPHIR